MSEKIKLFEVTTRRDFTELGIKTWGKATETNKHFAWAESAEAIEKRYTQEEQEKSYGLSSAYWRERFCDSLVSVVELDPAIEAEKTNRYPYMEWKCCPKAIKVECVCSFSSTCPEHGSQCIGTHD